VTWGFSTPANAKADSLDDYIQSLVEQYVNGKSWGHDTFMCGLDFLPLDLRYYRHGLLAKLVLLVYCDSNHSKLAQTTTCAGVPTRRHILELGDGSVAQTRAR